MGHYEVFKIKAVHPQNFIIIIIFKTVSSVKLEN